MRRTTAKASSSPGTCCWAASNLSSNLVDWAISTLRDEPLHSATDPEAKLIKAIAKKQLGATGLTRAALDDLLAIEGEQKFRTPISVWAEIADAARVFDLPIISQFVFGHFQLLTGGNSVGKRCRRLGLSRIK